MKKYYKVVYSSNLVSAVKCGHGEVQYKIGQFVYAPVQGTYLFVFDSKESALKFKKGSDVHRIYECEVEGLCDNPTNHSNEEWPQGTKFAYGVKLTKLVDSIQPFEFYSVISTGVYYTNKVNSDGVVEFEKNSKTPESGVYSQSQNNITLSYDNGKKNIFGFEAWHKSAWGNPVFSTRSKEKAESLSQLIQQGVVNPRTQI